MGNHDFCANAGEPQVEKLYAGDITPAQAWDILAAEKNSILVDVRTPSEWSFIGYPDLSSLDKKVIFLSWRLSPNMEVNHDFVLQLVNEIKLDKNDKVLLLCRSGGRSMDAAIALTEKGFNQCYNIEGGFEGEINESGHRGAKNGWKACNLPWEQR